MSEGIAGLIADMRGAVTDFLGGLDEARRAAVQLDFADQDERRRWFYTPTAQPGLPLLDMTPGQSQAAFRMLATGLSEHGYNHVALVIGLERILDYQFAFPARPYGGTPGTRIRHPGNYRVAVFGEPADRAWSWRFGGHHVALQFTVCGDAVSVTPAFFGGEPARAGLPGGAELRVMAAEEDNARALLDSFGAPQRAAATICPVSPTDMVQENAPRVMAGAVPAIGGQGPGGQVLRDYLRLTPAHDEMYRYTVAPKGLLAAEMTGGQRERLELIIRSYFAHLAEPIGAQYEHVLAPGALDRTSFAWAGPGEAGAPHYYRVQGERLLIEYNCAQNGANHKHSTWRDPLGDFGDALNLRLQHH